MDVYLIRHAQAGARNNSPRDMYRPLSEKGHARAAELAKLFSESPFTKVLSSPATRCAQTVAPLAAARCLDVEEHPDLWEGSGIDQVLALLEKHTNGGLVVCSHGDIIPELIETLGRAGVEVHGHGCEKGSVWILRRDRNEWVSARYVKRKAQSLG
jgi:8-oxo-dGTP diphosphatase